MNYDDERDYDEEASSLFTNGGTDGNGRSITMCINCGERQEEE